MTNILVHEFGGNKKRGSRNLLRSDLGFYNEYNNNNEVHTYFGVQLNRSFSSEFLLEIQQIGFEPGPPPCGQKLFEVINDVGWVFVKRRFFFFVPVLAPFCYYMCPSQ